MSSRKKRRDEEGSEEDETNDRYLMHNMLSDVERIEEAIC